MFSAQSSLNMSAYVSYLIRQVRTKGSYTHHKWGHICFQELVAICVESTLLACNCSKLTAHRRHGKWLPFSKRCEKPYPPLEQICTEYIHINARLIPPLEPQQIDQHKHKPDLDGKHHLSKNGVGTWIRSVKVKLCCKIPYQMVRKVKSWGLWQVLISSYSTRAKFKIMCFSIIPNGKSGKSLVSPNIDCKTIGFQCWMLFTSQNDRSFNGAKQSHRLTSARHKTYVTCVAKWQQKWLTDKCKQQE